MTDETEADLLAPHRLDLRSADVVEPRIEALAELVPEAVRDGKIDVDALKAALGDVADEGPERFGLTWPGKADAIRMAQRRAEGTLVPMKDESVEWDTTKNVVIEGENLEVLKLLQRSYHGKVKLIYIDPPYNTGKGKDFVYPDNYADPLGDYLRYSGQAGENGIRLRANTESSGRFHSAWLSMMWARMHLARALLRDDGLIMISIGEREVAHLRTLCDEIFGEENSLATLVWMKGREGGNDSDGFGPHHDYVLAYGRTDAAGRSIHLDEKDVSRHITALTEENRVVVGEETRLGERFQLINLSKQKDYEVEIALTDGTKIVWPSYMPQKSVDRAASEGRLYVGESGVPYVKSFLLDEAAGTRPSSLLESKWGTTKSGGKEFNALFPEGAHFDYPKPSSLIRRFVGVATDSDSLVLDFFAGSGATAQAVVARNAEDEGERRYILVQLPQPIDMEGSAGQTSFESVAAITRARAARSAASIDLKGRGNLDRGFRAYKYTYAALTPPVQSLDAQGTQEALPESSSGPERPDEALLAELLLGRGFDLAERVRWLDVEGASVAEIADGALLVCFSRLLTLEQFEGCVNRDPAQLIVLEAGFGTNDEIKVNALQHLKTINAHRQTPVELLVV